MLQLTKFPLAAFVLALNITSILSCFPIDDEDNNRPERELFEKYAQIVDWQDLREGLLLHKSEYSEKLFLKDLQDFTFGIAERPNIVFLFVDTLRADFVTADLAPNIMNFRKNSLWGNPAIAGAPNTHHSTFSIFFSQSARRKIDYHRNLWSHGAPAFQILKRNGYRMLSFSFPNFIQHLDIVPDSFNSETSNIALNYGVSSNTIFENITEPYNDILGPFPQDYFDPKLLDFYLDSLKNSEESKSEDPSFSFIWFYGNHDPYGWFEISNGLESVKQRGHPLVSNFFEDYLKDVSPAFDTFESTIRSKIVNAYRNSVMSTDYQFGRLINSLKASGQYDETLLVLVSDHGERLFDDIPIWSQTERRRIGHNGWPVKPLSHVEIAIKFPFSSNVVSHQIPLLTHEDIWPSIFDYLQLKKSNKYRNFSTGQSILRNFSRSCAVSIAPAFSKVPSKFIFQSKNHKIYLRVPNAQEDIKEIEVVLVNEQDKPLDFKAFLNGASIRTFIRTEFGECLTTL